ncbi:hypothetical protein [Actinophytocola sp. NPDC049390]|uniref:hypothetical protein n=1 Tax=Actinophytocola sp. NPDC049390 TaxID=3363894 RepID=UPI0037BD7C20
MGVLRGGEASCGGGEQPGPGVAHEREWDRGRVGGCAQPRFEVWRSDVFGGFPGGLRGSSGSQRTPRPTVTYTPGAAGSKAMIQLLT